MKIVRTILITFGFALLIFSCNDDKESIDKEKPKIDGNFSKAFPKNCDTLYFGESFSLQALFSDNVALGSFSIDLHNNFDQHSHTTEVTSCSLSPKKTPVNPFQLTKEFSLNKESKRQEVVQEIIIPAKNTKGVFDEGDYHFFISLTDKTGWSAQKGLSIKMLYRKTDSK